MLRGSNIIIGVTGSIAAYKSADIASRLTQKGARVEVLMTHSACRFVAPLTFSAITGNDAVHDLFLEKQGSVIPHIRYTRNPDIIVIAPATGNTISKLRGGLADDILSCAVLASKCPVLIAPAMNEDMYLNPIMQDHIQALTALGYEFIGPEKGFLSCGYEGVGRMTEPQKIVGRIEEMLNTGVSVRSLRQESL